jgi:hypothetical protein
MKRCFISKIRSDHDGELENLFEENDFKHEFSTSRTPQQNRVGEKKNSVLQEMGITMLNEYSFLNILGGTHIPLIMLQTEFFLDQFYI